MPSTRDYQSPGAILADLDRAALDRLADADAMFLSGRPAAAISMGVYGLEISLKARICRKLDLARLPRPFEIHDLEGLLTLSGLAARMKTAPSGVQLNWDVILLLASKINELRYSPDSNWTQRQAQDFLERLRNPPEGVLTWLTTQP
jgi:hypothetical protein